MVRTVTSFISLPWLPSPPDDFAALCSSAAASPDGGALLQYLAGHRLDSRKAILLARALARSRREGAVPGPLSNFRLGVLSNATVDMVVDYLAASALRHGVALDVTTAPYDQVMQQALDPHSSINMAGLDAVLLAVDHRWLDLERPALSADPATRIAAAIERLQTVVEGLRAQGGATTILQTLPLPPVSLFGSLDRRVAGTCRAMLEEANRRIIELAATTDSYLLDTASLASRIGTDTWFDPVQWVSYKLPFSADCAAAYGDMVGRLLGAIRGKARKCLVLDLDNTLWGGAIGDEGLDGIRIGQGDARGEAFLQVQQMALDLQARGIILAVCSKNDEANARAPFKEHPDMLLREEHIAVFQANWIDKPSNIEAIAQALNIGLDSLVMLDDNPAERAQIRKALPMVAVPELPHDPGWFAWYLDAAGYFETVSFSREDAIRAQSYAADAKRAEVMTRTRNLGDYLSSLEMTMSFAPFDRQGRQRIAQLINKTNQFNLTTRRYKESEVAAFEANPHAVTLQVRLEDRFGDLGMIGVIICVPPEEPNGAAWSIDTWLMSCRVLGRGVEQAMLSRLVSEVAARGGRQLTGRYIPTAKNGMVAEHYRGLGFDLVEESAGTTVWQLEIGRFKAPDLPMRIVEG